VSDDDVPARILAAARALFAALGYRATSMRRIAEAVGITKPGLYYHFPAKDEILRRLTEPLLDELECALDDAERHREHEAVRWHALEGYLDVCIRHRETLLMLVRDMSLLVEAPVAERFRGAVALANDLVAGPTSDLATRVRAAQAVAGLGDAVILFADADPRELRGHILSGVRALLAPAGSPVAPPATTPAAPPRTPSPTPAPPPSPGPSPTPAPAPSTAPSAGRGRPRGRRGGRPRLLDQDQVDRIRRLYAANGQTVEHIANELGVSRATVYRSLNSGSET
jgi:AcrR family transcriptional regulator